jgi:hypothetical protein
MALQVGSSGSRVQDLQRRLAAAGFNPGTADGDFGPRTRRAVEAFQRARGITVDGKVGTETSRALRERNTDRMERTTRTRRTDGGSTNENTAAERTRRTGSTTPGRGRQSLADTARRVALSMNGYRSRGQCAKGVNRAIREDMGIRTYGHGNQVDNNLPRSRFRELNISLEEALRRPGLVLTWERTSTRLGRIYGHTAITAGDGHTSYSDFVERNTQRGSRGRSGLRVFEPI